MKALNQNKAISYLAVFAVILALLLFTTVRLSPVATDSAALNQVNYKQRVMKIDAVVCVSLAPCVIALAPVVEPAFSAEPSSAPLFRHQARYFNRPPPVFA